MSEAISRSAKLVPYTRRPRGSAGYVTAFIFDAPPGDAEDLGSLFVVAEVLSPSKQSEEVVDLMIHTLGDTYYNQPIYEADSDQTQSELRFEAGLRAVNRELEAYTTSGHASWVGKLSAVLGVSSNDTLQVSNCGSAVAYLVRSGKTRAIIESVDTESASHTFTNLVAARLKQGDKIILATPALMHFFDESALGQLLGDHQPSLAIQSIQTAAKNQTQSERLAVSVVEITSADSIADEQLPGVSSSASLEAGPSLAAQATATVVPLVTKTKAGAIRLFRSIWQNIRTKIIPGMYHASLKLVQGLRYLLRTRNGRIGVLVGVFVVLIATFFGGYSVLQQQAFSKFDSQYKATLAKEERAMAQLSVGDKAGARLNLMQAKSELEALSSSHPSKTYDARVATLPHPEGVSPTLTALISYISGKIDTIDGLVKLNPTPIANFTALGTKPSFFEIVGTKGVFYDPAAGAFTLYDFPTAKLSAGVTSKALGNVVAMTSSSANDGVFLLTDSPSIWLYSIVDNTVTEQSVGFGEWPKGRSIASYNSNLYMLAADSSQIYKFGRTLTGFTGKSTYLPSGETTNLTGATALAVDGAVYLAGSNGIKRFLAGKLTAGAADLAGSLASPKRLRIASDGTTLLTVDGTTNRIGEVVFDGENMHYKQQFQATGIKDLADIVPDSRSKNLYILGDGQLWRLVASY